jgi:TolB-like protein
MASPSHPFPLILGRYAIYAPIAAGGMGTVHLARLIGPAGFSRTVAVKRLHRHLTTDPEFPAMLIDEARVASRIRHPNVVSTLDVVAFQDELILVMEYIHGESVLKLARAVQEKGELVPLRVVGAMLIDSLHGLHAAHEATDQRGQPLGVVHRDISPQNMLVGVDGVTRVADFGIAKASGRSHVTDGPSVKGKVAYMAPEQIQKGEATRATDIFAASIVLWELLTGRPLFAGRTDGQTVHNVLNAPIVWPSELVPTLPARLDDILRRGLARDAGARYATAREMAVDLEAAIEHIRPSEIGPWVERLAGPALAERAALIAEVEASEPTAADPDEPRTRRLHKDTPPTDPGRATERPSIAVLPFTNMSGDPQQEYFADGMVEDIVTALSRFKELLVIARNSSFAYKGRNVDVQQVARDLGVRYVLEGSVRKEGDQVRISGQLIDASTRAHLWADRFDGSFEHVFALQDRITESVVGALVPTLREVEIERARRKPPLSLDAYDYVLRALPCLIANTVVEADTAIKLLGEALRLDPDYAYAHALLATVYAIIYRSATGPEREPSRRQAVVHARRTLAIGSDDSVTLALAGFVLLVSERDVGGARAALDKAVALNSNCALAFGRRALVLAMLGEAEPAIDDAKRSLRLSPLDPARYLPETALAVAHVLRSEYDEALVCAHKAIAVNPRYPMGYAFAIVAECLRGNLDEAAQLVNRLSAVMPGFTPATLAALYDVYSDSLKATSLAVLRRAGFIPDRNLADGP